MPSIDPDQLRRIAAETTRASFNLVDGYPVKCTEWIDKIWSDPLTGQRRIGDICNKKATGKNDQGRWKCEEHRD